MSSFVRTLKRAVSSGKESEANSPQASPLALNQNRSISLGSSPSFSDFSLNAHADAETEFSDTKKGPTNSARSSLEESVPSSPRWLRSAFTGAAVPPAAALPVGQKSDISDSLPSKMSAPPQAVPRRKEGKIHGMDYYDYCELIRGSSL